MSNQFDIPIHLEATYRRAITVLMTREIPMDVNVREIDNWLSRVSSVCYSEQFIQESRRIAAKLVQDINVHNVFNWRELIRKTSGGSKFIPLLYKENLFKNEIDELTVLISTLPERLSKDLQNVVFEARSRGITEENVFAILKRRYANLLFKRIIYLSQTDPHRINTSITEVRSNDLNLPCFIWSSSKDEVVRFSHKRMDGVVCFWDNLPSPELLVNGPLVFSSYAPGGSPGCRCSSIPILSIEDLFTSIRSRIKVYLDNRIHLLTKLQFMKLLT